MGLTNNNMIGFLNNILVHITRYRRCAVTLLDRYGLSVELSGGRLRWPPTPPPAPLSLSTRNRAGPQLVQHALTGLFINVHVIKGKATQLPQ